MKKVLMASMALALVAALVGLGVYATFSDTETSSKNYFQAGSLDLKVDGEDDPNVATYFEVKNVKPGDAGEVDIKLTNAGSLDGTADLHITNLVDDENGVYEPEIPDDATTGELSQAIILDICYDDVLVKSGTLKDLFCQDFDLGALPAGESKKLTIAWKVDPNAGNNIMSDICTFDIVFSLH